MGVNGIYGLSGSGLDVESMVKVGMLSKQNELDKMQQKYTLNEWKKTEYLDLYGEVQTFNNSTLSQYKLSSTMNARSAKSSNETAVSATANGNAAPMQHSVEVGQLASAAYLLGTQAIERANTDKPTSTNLQDALFYSLKKNNDGEYEYTLKNSDGTVTTSTSTFKASDIAFTFKISDGTLGNEYVASSNENIFEAAAKVNGAWVTDTSKIPSSTKIASHTVLIESNAASAEKITSLKLDGLTTATGINEAFAKIFGMTDAEYTARFSRLATNANISTQTAFTLVFDDGNSSLAAANKNVEFKYSDLISSDSFYTKIKNVIDPNGNSDVNKIAINVNSDGTMSFSNSETGSANRINISIDTSATNFIGTSGTSATTDHRLSIAPQILSESLDILKGTDAGKGTAAKASDVFKSLLALDGDTATAKEYINRYSDSNDIALSIQFTDTQNGTATPGTVDITFAQLASTDTFINELKKSFALAGFDTASSLYKGIYIDTATGTLQINNNGTQTNATNTNVATNYQNYNAFGSDSSIAFSVKNIGVGDTDHPYPSATPPTQIIPNATISNWFKGLTTIDTANADYNKKISELEDLGIDINAANASTHAVAFTFDDGINPSSTTYLSFADLADTTTTIGAKLKSLAESINKNNIKISADNDTIKIYNDTFGSDSKISITMELGSLFSSTTTFETSGKIRFDNIATDAIASDTFKPLVELFNSNTKDLNSYISNNATAFSLTFSDSDSSPTSKTVNFTYGDLKSATTVANLLKNKLSGSGFDVRTGSGKIAVYNTETGTASHISVTGPNSDTVTIGDANHRAGTELTKSITYTSDISDTILSKARDTLQSGTSSITSFTVSSATGGNFYLTLSDNSSTDVTSNTASVSLTGIGQISSFNTFDSNYGNLTVSDSGATIINNSVYDNNEIGVTGTASGSITVTYTATISTTYVYSTTVNTTTTNYYNYTYKGTLYNTTESSVTRTDTLSLDASQFASNVFTGINNTTTPTDNINTDAHSEAANSITSLFTATEGSVTGVNQTFVNSNTFVVTSTGDSEDQNAALVENINTFLGTSPQVGDYGEDYTPDFFATKLMNFFSGGNTDAITQSGSTYSIEEKAADTVIRIDGETATGTWTTDANGKSVFTTNDMQYTFKNLAGDVGKGGVAFAKNDIQEISVTYEQLANGFTFNDLVSEINSLGLNVRATYDSVQDRFSIYNKESGIDNSIMLGFGDNTGTNTILNSAIDRTIGFFDKMGLSQTENGAIVSDAEFAAGQTTIIQGKNAIAKIDGIDYTNLSKNNVTVNGVTYNFNGTTNTNLTTKYKQDSKGNYLDSTGAVTTDTSKYVVERDAYGNEVKIIDSSAAANKVTVNVTQDTDAIAAKVKSFVEEYNAIMKKLYTWYDEKPNEKYKPLTASQKEGMKDEQIEKWEEKAKAGMLYHDKTLYSIISQMRSVVSERIEGVTGKYNSIFALGISTTGTKGQLTIDEEKLNAALAADADSVYNIFSKLDRGETQYLVKLDNGTQIWTTDTSRGTPVKKDGKTVTKTVERASYNGIVQRLSDILNTGLKNLRTVAGSSADVTEDSDLNNLLRELQTKMSNFQRMMQAFETRLYKKYDAMESSLALLGAQLNYVTGAFQ